MQATIFQSLTAQAYNQQQLTGNKQAAVSVFVKGKWPDSGRKRLFGKSGPYGVCAAEYEDSVMCLFKADEVIAACAPHLPRLTITQQEPRHAAD